MLSVAVFIRAWGRSGFFCHVGLFWLDEVHFYMEEDVFAHIHLYKGMQTPQRMSDHLFGGQWPNLAPNINHHICPTEDKGLDENSAWMLKDGLGRDPGFKISYLSPLPWEVAIPFYRCVNRGSMGARESSNILDILWTLGNGGAGLFVLLCHGSVSTVMAAPALICSLGKFAKSH